LKRTFCSLKHEKNKSTKFSIFLKVLLRIKMKNYNQDLKKFRSLGPSQRQLMRLNQITWALPKSRWRALLSKQKNSESLFLRNQWDCSFSFGVQMLILLLKNLFPVWDGMFSSSKLIKNFSSFFKTRWDSILVQGIFSRSSLKWSLSAQVIDQILQWFLPIFSVTFTCLKTDFCQSFKDDSFYNSLVC